MTRPAIPITPQAVAVILLLAAAGGTVAAAADPGASEWRTWEAYGGGPSQAKYSSLDQVNRDNVQRLEVAWSYDSGDLDPDAVQYHEARRLQHTPIILGDRLYGVSPALRVFALDAASGELIWQHETDWGEGRDSMGGVVLRGLMQWQGQRLFYTARHYLYALDMATGEAIGSFGEGGRVDLRQGLGRPPELLGISATSPGVVFEDLLILGSSVSETLPAAPGDVRAFDVRTGELKWSFHTIPHPGEFGHDTWPQDAWTYAGGANAWSGISLDPVRGMVFFGTGSAADDFYGANRHGDNLFANSIVALDARSGERRWHFQVVKHDVWDRDLPAPPALVTVQRGGRAVDAVAQITKSGHVFVLDRDTGASLFPLEERAVPASMVPGEQLAATQVLPSRPAPFARQVFDASTVTTRTPEANAWVRERLTELTSGGPFTPPDTRGVVVFPGFDGGGEWGGPAFDPETGVLYVNANEMPWLLQLEEKKPLQAGSKAADVYATLCASCHGDERQGGGEFPALTDLKARYDAQAIADLLEQGRGRMPTFAEFLDGQGRWALADYLLEGWNAPINSALGADSPLFLRFRIKGYPLFTDPDGYPANAPPWGTLNAIDLNSGDYAWRIPLGHYPELAAQGMADTGSMNYGGPVVTAGGLVFIAATLFDDRIRAFDKASGELLWEHALPAAGVATPAVYESRGRQFIVISAGGHKFGGRKSGVYTAFALPAGGR